MTAETKDATDNRPDAPAMGRRYRNAAAIGALIGVPTAWAISVATGISFDSVLGAIIVAGGVAILLILDRAKGTEN